MEVNSWCWELEVLPLAFSSLLAWLGWPRSMPANSENRNLALSFIYCPCCRMALTKLKQSQ
jgi:hypothetical protein